MFTEIQEHISTVLEELAAELSKRKDSEVEGLSFVLPQYVADHNDKAAYRAIDKQVNALAKAYDRMIALIEKTAKQAQVIEQSVDSFYGD